MMLELHKLQSKVLRELSRHPSRRFTEIMKVTELTSDDFKFHLRKLIKLGLVTKTEDGLYQLTAAGKELANRFDYEERQPIKQPKITTVAFVYRDTGEGVRQYLFQQRKRQPFYGYWGVIGEPVRWGEPFDDAAKRGIAEQTGLDIEVEQCGVYRQRDYEKESGKVLEDKLFVIFAARLDAGEPKEWKYATNWWAAVGEFRELEDKKFDSCLAMLRVVEGADRSTVAEAESSFASHEY